MKKLISYLMIFAFITSINIVITLLAINSSNEVNAQEVMIEKELIPIEEKEPTYQLTYETKEKTTYLGMFTLTAYCSCAKCCGKYAENRPIDENGEEIVIGSIGTVLKTHHSIAVDPDVIPYGTTVVINGEEYVAEDCGGAIKDYRIDVYFNDHDEALEFGIQKADVYVREVY